MKNKIEDLRNHLFATLEGLLDRDKPLDIERAKAVADTAQVIVNSAKVEVEFMRIAGVNKGTGFISIESKIEPARAGPTPRLVRGSASHD